MNAKRLLPAALALGAAGCATLPAPYQANPGTLLLPQLVVYQDSTGPLSYQAPTAEALAGRTDILQVQGRACQSGVQFPLALLVGFFESNGEQASAVASLSAGWGEGGYAQAFEEALQKARRLGQGGRLFDVRADLNVVQVLGVWRQQCLVVTASVPGPSR